MQGDFDFVAIRVGTETNGAKKSYHCHAQKQEDHREMYDSWIIRLEPGGTFEERDLSSQCPELDLQSDVPIVHQLSLALTFTHPLIVAAGKDKRYFR